MGKFDEDEDDLGEDVGEFKCIRETSKALLVKDEGGEKTWVPKSVITDESEVNKEGDEGVLIVKKWFAEKEFG